MYIDYDFWNIFSRYIIPEGREGNGEKEERRVNPLTLMSHL